MSLGFNRDAFEEWYNHAGEVLEECEIKKPGEIGGVAINGFLADYALGLLEAEES